MAGKKKSSRKPKEDAMGKRLKVLEEKVKVMEKQLAEKAKELDEVTKKEREAVVKYAKENPEKALTMAFLLGLLVGLLKR